MSCGKQLITVRASAVRINGSPANTAFTSDPIEFKTNGAWSLNVWFDSLTVSGKNPTVTLQVSNDTDPDSFSDLTGAVEIDVANNHMIESQFSRWKYMRIVYAVNGVTGGTQYYNLVIG
jgi:hypothetical protein